MLHHIQGSICLSMQGKMVLITYLIHAVNFLNFNYLYFYHKIST